MRIAPTRYEGLQVLAMCLVNDPMPDSIRFDYFVANATAGYVVIPLADLQISEEGEVPESWDLKQLAKGGGPPALLAEFLRQVEADSSGKCLFLDFTAPSGGLPLLPWEDFIDSSLSSPVFRLPANRLPQVMLRKGPVTVAFCASLPFAKAEFDADDLILRGVQAVLNANPGNHCHIFRDLSAEEGSSFQRRLAALGDSRCFTVHDPGAAAKYGIAPRTNGAPEVSTAAASPWLSWMEDALAGSRVEMLHFICHGYFASGSGNVAFAPSPLHNEDRSWARFVGSDELAGLLGRLKIPSLGLTSPAHNHSPLGLRALAIEVARKFQGSVMLYDAALDRSGESLREAMRLLLADTNGIQPDRLKGLMIYGDPLRFAGRFGAGPREATGSLESFDKTDLKELFREGKALWDRAIENADYKALEEFARKLGPEVPAAVHGLSTTLHDYVNSHQSELPVWAATASQILRTNYEELQISRHVEDDSKNSPPTADLNSWNKGREDALEFLSGVIDSSLKELAPDQRSAPLMERGNLE